MTVRHILDGKQKSDLLTITPGATVQDAARILSEMRIGALIVSRDGQALDGMLSERDIVRELGRRGPSCMSDAVEALMTKEVVTADPADTAIRALEKMTHGRFRHLPVVKDGKMIGVVSIGDVVKHRIDEVERENSALTEMIVGHG